MRMYFNVKLENINIKFKLALFFFYYLRELYLFSCGNRIFCLTSGENFPDFTKK